MIDLMEGADPEELMQKAIYFAVRAAACRLAIRTDPVRLRVLERTANKYSGEASRLLDLFVRLV